MEVQQIQATLVGGSFDGEKTYVFVDEKFIKKAYTNEYCIEDEETPYHTSIVEEIYVPVDGHNDVFKYSHSNELSFG